MPDLQYPVNVVIVGMGAMGKGLFYQCLISPAFKCMVICDIKIDKAIDYAEWLKVNYKVVETEEQLSSVVSRGYPAWYASYPDEC
ncbi:MAG: hypothetical protein K9G67_15600 [Bacteroidales bacterium]|nr:hypothetical protein [Bacteroidales bacterium]MCF8351693.1 hypothetical protein [Bacteroidales bacterium]MCF8377781.1 hypothetical protein [Bacteroidales bacterium]